MDARASCSLGIIEKSFITRNSFNIFYFKGGMVMLKITEAALSEITKEVQSHATEGQNPMVRLSMGIG